MRYVLSKTIKLKDKKHFTYSNGIWTGEDQPLKRAKILRNTNFTDEGFLDYDDVAEIEIEEKCYPNKFLINDDILIERSGGGPNTPVGRVALYNGADNVFAFSNFTTRLRIISGEIDSNYLHLYLLHLHWSKQTEKVQTQTTNLRNLEFDKYLAFDIKFPETKREQTHIAAEITEKLASIKQMYDAALIQKEAVEALQNSILKEAFKYTEGDKLPSDWHWVKIKDVAQFKNGINYSEADVTKGVKIVGVGSFKKYFYVKEELLGEISSEIVGASNYLEDGDLVIVRSNGNPALVGRHLLFKGNNAVTHSGFTIRLRLDKNELHPEYYLLYSKSSFFKDQIKGQGSNISNLSQDKLKKVVLPAPKDIDEQKKITKEYLYKIEQIEELKSQIETQMEAITALPASTLRDYFN